MAKILFFNVPAHGHVNATFPLVRELVERGHEVRYYCSDEFQASIERSGATFCAYPISAPDAAEVVNGISSNLSSLVRLLLEMSEVLVPFAIEEIEREQPDLVMYDAITLWGKIAARATKSRDVVLFTIMAFNNLWVLGMRRVLEFARMAIPEFPRIVWLRRKIDRKYGPEALGKQFFPVKGQTNIVFLPRIFQPENRFVDDSFIFVGPSIDPSSRPEQDWQPLETELPQVYISLGTIHNANTDFYRTAFAAFGDYPSQFVLSVGPKTDISQLEPIPDNFLVKNSVPQLRVLQDVDAFITHGGMNSMQEGLYYGVPQVVVPQQMEQLVNALRIDDLGAGIWLDVDAGITPDMLCDALDRVLNEAHFWTKAQEVSIQSQTAGGYKGAADAIESLVN
ncbi:MAG: glycosyl transferase [Anaerolineaceae bacterium]|nr:glycosyl transferase [Anaerolineaceae bacterium]